MQRLLVLSTCLIGCASSNTARVDAARKADALHRQALLSEKAGELEAARVLWTRAEAMDPAKIIYSVNRLSVADRLGRSDASWRIYKRIAVRLKKERPEVHGRVLVKLVARLRRTRARITLTPGRDDIAAAIDAKRWSSPWDIWVAPGPHELSLDSRGRTVARLRFDAAVGGDYFYRIEGPELNDSLRVTGWATLGAGVAAVVAASALYGSAIAIEGRAANLPSIREIGEPEYLRRFDDAIGRSDTHRTAATVVMIIGGAAVSTGAILLLLDHYRVPYIKLVPLHSGGAHATFETTF